MSTKNSSKSKKTHPVVRKEFKLSDYEQSNISHVNKWFNKLKTYTTLGIICSTLNYVFVIFYLVIAVLASKYATTNITSIFDATVLPGYLQILVWVSLFCLLLNGLFNFIFQLIISIKGISCGMVSNHPTFDSKVSSMKTIATLNLVFIFISGGLLTLICNILLLIKIKDMNNYIENNQNIQLSI